MKIYSEKTRVKSYHVDKNENLSTVQVFNFLQEAAYQHSVIDKFGQPDLADLGLVWMLSRMKVVLFNKVELGEIIEIKSWVRSIKGALSERDFLVISNGKVVVKATSLWACLSINPVKPAAIPSEIAARMVAHLADKVALATSKIEAINEKFASQKYVIRPSDVDMVNHTNNVVYIRIMLDAIRSVSNIKQINVNYLRQSFEGDRLTINTEAKEGQSRVIEIVNQDENVVCRLACEWF